MSSGRPGPSPEAEERCGVAEHAAHPRRLDAGPAAMGDRLIEQRQSVAHRALGDAGNQRQSLRLDGDAFLGVSDEIRNGLRCE